MLLNELEANLAWQLKLSHVFHCLMPNCLMLQLTLRDDFPMAFSFLWLFASLIDFAIHFFHFLNSTYNLERSTCNIETLTEKHLISSS